MSLMNYSTAIFLVNDQVRAVAVSYEVDAEGKGVRPFHLFKTMDHDLAAGDYVVIPTDTRHKQTVARVETLNVDVDPASPAQLGWIIDRVDTTARDQIVEAETQAIERIKSAERRRQREELADKLRADNPDLNALGAINSTALPAPAEPGS